MGLPVHFPNGVTNVSAGDPLFHFTMPDPTKWVIYHNDFHTYTATDWTITTTEAGAGDATEALTDGAGGQLLITNDAADDDADFFQKVGEGFRWSSTKKMFFKARFKTSDATQSDIVMGLQITDTTPLDVTDGLFFIKADGAATVNFRIEKDNTATALSSVATLANDTFVELAFAYLPQHSGGPVFEVYVDGVRTASTTTTTNAPNDEDLTISFGIQNGEAVAKTLTVDYIFAAVER